MPNDIPITPDAPVEPAGVALSDPVAGDPSPAADTADARPVDGDWPSQSYDEEAGVSDADSADVGEPPGSPRRDLPPPERKTPTLAEARALQAAREEQSVQRERDRQRLEGEGRGEQQRAANGLQARIDSGEISVEEARAQLAASEALRGERQQVALERAQAQRLFDAQQEMATARAFESHQDSYPELGAQGGREIVLALAHSGFGDVGQLAPLLGQILRASGERAVAEYVARQEQNLATPTPVGGPGNAPVSSSAPDGAATPWSRLLGIR